MKARASHPQAQRRTCLTELSTTALVACAVGVSISLWLAILAVL